MDLIHEIKYLEMYLNITLERRQEWILVATHTIIENYKENLTNVLKRWLALLETEGINSKSMVMNDLQQTILELEKRL